VYTVESAEAGQVLDTTVFPFHKTLSGMFCAEFYLYHTSYNLIVCCN